MKPIFSGESSAIISLCLGIINLSVASGIVDKLFWGYIGHLDPGTSGILDWMFILSIIFGLKLGKDGFSSKREKIALAGFFLTLFSIINLFWFAWQIRDFHIY